MKTFKECYITEFLLNVTITAVRERVAFVVLLTARYRL